MPISRAKPVDALYDEVSDHDLVLVPDAALASALNRRIDRPHFGTFATTPRRLAAGRRERDEERRAFLAVAERTGHDWKAISYAVGNVLQCWEHEGARDAILEYDAYVDEVTGAAVEVLGDLRTTSSQLVEYEVDEESVAVVGERQLTALGRSIVPDDADRVDPFADEALALPDVHRFESAGAIVDAILDTVDAESAGDVAVVLAGGSRYASLVEAALAAADVPHYGGPGFVDQPHVRCFLRLCRAAFRGEATRVADVAAVLAQCGVDVPVADARKRLAATELPGAPWCREFCAELTGRTFSEALATYEDHGDADLGALHDELAELGLADEPVTRERVDDLAYYLQSYEVPVEREHEGVLLADATSSGFVDRPVVFHVGLDDAWTASPPSRPWVDADAAFDRALDRFQLLVQSGVEQYLLVQDARGGEPVTPCLYLRELLDGGCERFADLDGISHGPRAGGAGSRRATSAGDGVGGDDAVGFAHEPVDAAAEPVETVSQSTLRSFVNCPRDHCFGRLLGQPDRDYLVEGGLFHDFAEFYANHPDAVDAATVEAVVEEFLRVAEPLFDGHERPLRRRRYRLGLETVVEYLDRHGPEDHDFLDPDDGWGRNRFADHFGRPVDSPLTERWFEDPDLGIGGKIDLVRAPDHLVDYKSGSRKSARDVVRHAATDPPDDRPNFQAPLYLAHLRDRQPDRPLAFTFVHFLETLEDLVAGEHDLADALTTVTYYPRSFDEHVGSRAAFEELLDGYGDCVETFEDLGFERYAEIVDGLTFPDAADRAAVRDSEFADALAAAVDDATSDDVDAEKGCDQAVRALYGLRRRAFFREDLDAVVAFADECREALNRYRTGEERFPIEGPGGEPNYRWVDHRDLLLEGEAR